MNGPVSDGDGQIVRNRRAVQTCSSSSWAAPEFRLTLPVRGQPFITRCSVCVSVNRHAVGHLFSSHSFSAQLLLLLLLLFIYIFRVRCRIAGQEKEGKKINKNPVVPSGARLKKKCLGFPRELYLGRLLLFLLPVFLSHALPETQPAGDGPRY